MNLGDISSQKIIKGAAKCFEEIHRIDISPRSAAPFKSGGFMKKGLWIVLFCPLLLLAQNNNELKKEKSSYEEYDAGKIDGELQAGQNNYGSCCWASGCASMPLGIFGGGIITLISYNSPDQPTIMPSGSSYYRKGFLDGYQNKTKSKKGHAAVVGCVAGFLVNAAALVLIFSL